MESLDVFSDVDSLGLEEPLAGFNFELEREQQRLDDVDGQL